MSATLATDKKKTKGDGKSGGPSHTARTVLAPLAVRSSMCSAHTLGKSKTGDHGRACWQPANIPTAQFCLSIPPLGNRQVNFTTPTTPAEALHALAAMRIRAVEVTEKHLKREHSRLRHLALAKEGASDIGGTAEGKLEDHAEHDEKEEEERSVTMALGEVESELRRTTAQKAQYMRLKYVGSLLANLSGLLADRLAAAVRAGVLNNSACSPGSIDVLPAGTYLPVTARLGTEYADPSRTIVRQGNSVRLRKRGLYQLFYRVPALFVQGFVNSGDTPAFPDNFAAVVIALVARQGLHGEARVIPHTVNLLLPSEIDAQVFPLQSFFFFSNPFQYPTATADYRACDCRTRISAMVFVFSNVTSVEAALPLFFDIGGVLKVARMHD